MIVFHDGRYVEILKAAPSTNKKLKSVYKVESLDLFTNEVNKEYFSYGQIERLDKVDCSKLDVEFQYFDEERNLLIVSDDLYNQHEIPPYLFRGHIPALQPGSRFSVLMDGDRYIKMI